MNGGFVSTAKEPKPGPYTFDITLKRGVLVRGRLTDKVTGQPVQGAVTYYAMSDNSHLDEFPNFKRGARSRGFLSRVLTGEFTIPALPGHRRLIALPGAPRTAISTGSAAACIKGFDGQMGAFRTAPFYCPTSDQHVLAEINPAAGTSEVTARAPGRPWPDSQGHDRRP